MSHYQFIIIVIRLEREERGIPVAELARRADMTEDQLGSSLRGRRVLKGDELVRLCVVLGLPLEALIPPEMARRAQQMRGRTIEEYGSGARAGRRVSGL